MTRYNKTIKKLLSYSAMFLLVLQLIIPSVNINNSAADKGDPSAIFLNDGPTEDTRN